MSELEIARLEEKKAFDKAEGSFTIEELHSLDEDQLRQLEEELQTKRANLNIEVAENMRNLKAVSEARFEKNKAIKKSNA